MIDLGVAPIPRREDILDVALTRMFAIYMTLGRRSGGPANSGCCFVTSCVCWGGGDERRTVGAGRTTGAFCYSPWTAHTWILVRDVQAPELARLVFHVVIASRLSGAAQGWQRPGRM